MKRLSRGKSANCVLIVTALAFGCTPRVYSQTLWIGGTGNWFPPNSSWWCGGPCNAPNGAGLTANIGTLFGTPIGPVAGTVTLNGIVNIGGVSLGNGAMGSLIVNNPVNTLTAGGINVGNNPGGAGALTIQSGGSVSSGSYWIGALAGSNGNTLVTGANSQLNASGQFLVGDNGQGALSIQNGGVVASSGGLLGFQSGSAGQVTVSGAGSQWNDAGGIGVGNFGQGTLTIQNGGIMNGGSSGAITVGSQVGGVGQVTVTGAGSQWNTPYLVVANLGQAAINIQNGGQVNSGFSNLGNRAGSSGSLSVDGAGSQWNVATAIAVGNNGNGTLNITNGGLVSTNPGCPTCDAGVVGESSGSKGSVTISGAGSTWKNNGPMSVGESGTGTLSVSSGGLVTSANLSVGSFTGASGTLTINSGGQVTDSGGAGIPIGSSAGTTGAVTVSDAGSSMSTSGPLKVGDAGQGTLTVQNGGQVVSGGQLTVGNSGSGVLNINSGGVMSTTGGATLGFQSGSTGSVTVTGSGSTWNNTGPVLVGWNGNGTLTISNGGAVTSAGALHGSAFVVAEPVGSTGSVSVSGSGSTLTNNGVVNIGFQGNGTLTISNGAVVNNTLCAACGSAGSGMYIGQQGGAVGTVTIDSGGQLLNVGIAQIGSSAGSTGSVTVSGAGSQWNNAGSLTVGASGDGTLTIDSGASVTDGSAIVGQNAGSNGTVVVDGGSWVTTGALSVGTGGTGAITIENGGTLSAGNTTIGSSGSMILDPSIANIFGNFTLDPGGVLTLDISGDSPGLFSQLDISGFGLFSGTIDLDFIDGFAPTAGETFDLINANGGANFGGATFQIEGLTPGFQYSDSFANGELTLAAINNGTSTTASPEPHSGVLFGSATFFMLLAFLCKRAAIRRGAPEK